MDPFATLGVAPTFDVDRPAMERTHRELSRALHPDKYVGASASERRAALLKAVEVNEAWAIVRDPIRRAESLLELRGFSAGESEGKPTPEFLMEMLEQREALSEARQARDAAAVRRMAAAAEAHSRDVERALSEGFARVEGASLAGLAGKVGELRFYRRLLDEVSAIEDELAA